MQVLTGMVGFYTTGTQEVVYPGRRLVVQDTQTGEFSLLDVAFVYQAFHFWAVLLSYINIAGTFVRKTMLHGSRFVHIRVQALHTTLNH